MKLPMSECPYCKDKSSVMLDVERLEVSVESHLDRGKACPHLAFACVALSAESQGRGKQPARACSRVWFWRRGLGWRGLSPFKYNPLYDYVVGLACDVLLDGEKSPRTPYVVTGASAMAREQEQGGSGYLTWTVPGVRGRIAGLLDGYGIYSPKPKTLVTEVNRLARATLRIAQDSFAAAARHQSHHSKDLT
jgi:hypothetical protein